MSSMTEVGLVRFARIVLEIAEAALPDYLSQVLKTHFHSATAVSRSVPYALRGVDCCVRRRFGSPSRKMCRLTDAQGLLPNHH
jgi:hypothetical protein